MCRHGALRGWIRCGRCGTNSSENRGGAERSFQASAGRLGYQAIGEELGKFSGDFGWCETRSEPVLARHPTSLRGIRVAACINLVVKPGFQTVSVRHGARSLD